ncbi:MAG: GEVED domain-containing protein [Pseudomonadota bacterium]
MQSAVALCIALSSGAAQAQLCEGIPGLTINGGFEVPDLGTTPPTPARTFSNGPPAARTYFESDVPGWETTAPDNEIEIWDTGFNSTPSYEGLQHAEVNANSVAALFQDITTTPGSEIVWSFAHRGRGGVDTIQVEMGAPGGTLVDQGAFSTGNTAWDVKTGTYVVPAGQTTTRFQFRAVTSGSVGNFIDAVIISPLCDYGDAPSLYPVLRADGGAAHRISTGAFLGSSVDAETDGQPNANATGDDSDGNDDEDGVAFGLGGSAELIRRARNALEITASSAGYVNVWVDYDQNGTWSAAEQIFTDEPVSAGTQSLEFTVPNSANLGTTYARVRYSTDNTGGSMGPGGDWPNGEAEDTQLVVIGQAVLAIAKSSQSFVDTGVGDGSDFKSPQNDVLYSITVSNIGEGPVDTNSVLVIDAFPAELEFFNGDANGTGAGSGRVIFTDNGTGLSFNPVNDVAFSNSAIAPTSFAACNYNPASGYIGDVTYICFNPKGVMQDGPPDTSFQLQFKARIK